MMCCIWFQVVGWCKCHIHGLLHSPNLNIHLDKTIGDKVGKENQMQCNHIGIDAKPKAYHNHFQAEGKILNLYILLLINHQCQPQSLQSVYFLVSSKMHILGLGFSP